MNRLYFISNGFLGFAKAEPGHFAKIYHYLNCRISNKKYSGKLSEIYLSEIKEFVEKNLLKITATIHDQKGTICNHYEFIFKNSN